MLQITRLGDCQTNLLNLNLLRKQRVQYVFRSKTNYHEIPRITTVFNF